MSRKTRKLLENLLFISMLSLLFGTFIYFFFFKHMRFIDSFGLAGAIYLLALDVILIVRRIYQKWKKWKRR